MDKNQPVIEKRKPGRPKIANRVIDNKNYITTSFQLKRKLHSRLKLATILLEKTQGEIIEAALYSYLKRKEDEMMTSMKLDKTVFHEAE